MVENVEVSKEYDLNFKKPTKKLKQAFKQVCAMRQFEIKLYWERAKYFWTLIGVAFAGYFVISTKEKIGEYDYFYTMIIAGIGFIFSFAWHLANKGSKYWQENWENHLDLLEDDVTGPLYKTILQRPLKGDPPSLIEKIITGPAAFSVSKINQWVSAFVIFIWFILLIFSGYQSFLITNISIKKWLIVNIHFVVFIVPFITCVCMLAFGRTYREKQNPVMKNRSTKIKGKIE